MPWFSGVCVAITGRVPVATEEITISSTPVGFTPAKIAPTTGKYKGMQARYALLSLEDADIRFYLDGTSPSASSGHPMPASDERIIGETQALEQFLAVKSGETDAKATVTYFF